MATLHGIRVVSTAVNIPGPVAAAMLRDRGASVVKIEPPHGDPLAAAAPEWYAALCAGIDVERLDLKSAQGQSRLHARLGAADVLLTSSRPASLERLGLSWTALHARHTRLCQIAIAGYPEPRHDDAGHDLTYQADAGLVMPPAMPATLIADLAGAQQAVIAALDLLLVRERSGTAGYVEVALSAAAALFAAPVRHGLTCQGGWLGGGMAAYNLYPARDGWVAVAALEPHFRISLARELGIDIEDRQAMTRTLATRTADEWDVWARERGLPVAAVR